MRRGIPKQATRVVEPVEEGSKSGGKVESLSKPALIGLGVVVFAVYYCTAFRR